MKNRKLLWVIFITIGGILIGMTLDDYLFGNLNSSGLIQLIPTVLLLLVGAWNIVKE